MDDFLNKPQIREMDSSVSLSDRTISGRVLKFGDIARVVTDNGIISERFNKSAFGNLEGADVILNLQHTRNRPIARTPETLKLSVDDDGIQMRAELPDGSGFDEVLELVRNKILRGLSVEFVAKKAAMINGIREIQEAILTGIGIVDRPAYPNSTLRNKDNTYRRPLWL